MLRLHRINWPIDRMDYAAAWGWMRDQPELYSQDIGYSSFGEFIESHGLERIEFALRSDGELIGFAYLVYKSPKSCEFGLITPKRPRVRSILALLYELQREYFETLRGTYLFAVCVKDPMYDRTRRLCQMYGLREASPHVFEITILDHLRAAEEGEIEQIMCCEPTRS